VSGPVLNARGPRLPEGLDAGARALATTVVEAAGEHLAGILLYGSQLLRAEPNEHSAWDLVLVVERYGPFHRALVDAGLQSRPVPLLNVMGHLLPPSVTAVEAADRSAIGKCLIVSRRHFRRALLPRSPDHFLKGRMVQRVALIWARDDRTAGAIEGWLRRARRDVLAWAGPWVEEPFDATSLTRRMLEVSYGGELRPENRSRALEIHEAQAEWLHAAYTEVLEEAVSDGELLRSGEGEYGFARPPGAWMRLRSRAYFLRSKTRATLRWFKYIATFDGWLPYLVRKVERRTGERIELSPLERKLPLIFLWPRVFRFFLSPSRRTPSDEQVS